MGRRRADRCHFGSITRRTSVLYRRGAITFELLLFSTPVPAPGFSTAWGFSRYDLFVGFPRWETKFHGITPRKETRVIEKIIQTIDDEIARLQKARDILQGGGRVSHRSARSVPAGEHATRPRRRLSRKARHAISEAQRKRWAKVKSREKSTSAETEKSGAENS